MHPVIEQLLSRKPIVIDGAWGTQLQQRGLPIGGCPETWNLEQPEKVSSVARAYVEAGAAIVLTNSFGGSHIMLERHNLAEKTREVNVAAAKASCDAAAGKALVFGSIGPTGKMVMMGDISKEELVEVFAEQAQALKEGGVDGLVIETMSDLDEATAAIAGAKQTGLPVIACMVYASGATYDRTMMGTTPQQAAEALEAAGADVIGANCGMGIEASLPVCKQLRAATNLPIWIKANAGLPEMVDGSAVYSMTPEEFSAKAKEMVEAGADFVGGCCGTSPEIIKAVVATLHLPK